MQKRTYTNLYVGKYRGKVLEVKGHKVRVKCATIWGDYASPWCVPCVPILMTEKVFYEINKNGKPTDHTHTSKSLYRIPKVGEEIWIECEEGNSDKPIWVGLTSF